jgi:hypothetical protein
MLRFTAVIFLCTSAAALAQRPSQPDDYYTALMQQICRQYADAQRGMPPDLMFSQCMSERHCRVSSGSSGYQCEVPGPMTWHGGGY